MHESSCDLTRESPCPRPDDAPLTMGNPGTLLCPVSRRSGLGAGLRWEDAELVPLGVGEDDLGSVLPLPDVDPERS